MSHRQGGSDGAAIRENSIDIQPQRPERRRDSFSWNGQDCPHCRRRLREVGERSWNLSDLGRRAPWWRVDVASGLPAEPGFLREWRVTPGLVQAAIGAEISRITSHQGDLFFWQQAEALPLRLPG